MHTTEQAVETQQEDQAEMQESQMPKEELNLSQLMDIILQMNFETKKDAQEGEDRLQERENRLQEVIQSDAQERESRLQEPMQNDAEERENRLQDRLQEAIHSDAERTALELKKVAQERG